MKQTILVAGAIANKYRNGGEAWVRLSWVRGFQRLGFDVHFVEQLNASACVDVEGHACEFDRSAPRQYFSDVIKQFGLMDRASLVFGGGEQSCGMTYRELTELAASASLLVNISGHLTLPALFRAVRRRAYVDIDPGFTQFWQASGGDGARLAGHDVYFTIGRNIGEPNCSIPTAGICWHKTRQPVLLDDWPVVSNRGERGFTTIANWRGPFGPVTFNGQTFGLKVHQFRKFIQLPQMAPQRFEIALAIHPADVKDLEALKSNGWHVVDPSVTATPDGFREYIAGSMAEFSAAQGIYVDTNSGWFSDRTVRYLASGKPALVQDTGFGNDLPVGEGLISFKTIDEAASGARAIASDHVRHAKAARRIAEEYFASEKVLSNFLSVAGVS